MFERGTLIIFCSPPACIILTGVTGVRLSLQNAVIAPTPCVCACVGAYVCTRIPARYKSTPNEMKKAYWNKRLVLSLKDNGFSVPLVVQQKGGRSLLLLKNAAGRGGVVVG